MPNHWLLKRGRPKWLLVLLIIVLVFYYNLLSSNKVRSRSKITKNQPYAYASLLCDDVMIEATKVLIHSLKKTGTPYPFLLLILPGVTKIDDLLRLGAELHRITPLDYPFKVSAEKTAINKMCRYSKLHIWRFTRFKKIVFVDVDTLITQNIDAVFRWPEFSAVRDAGDTFNTGLFVLEPSKKTYSKMVESYFSAPSYNQGDQGFLNYFFKAKHTLPVRYNTVCKLKSHAQWPTIRKQARMLHFTSETKPWTFFQGAHRLWKQNYEQEMFHEWARAYRQVSKNLQIDAHDPERGQWFNAERVENICSPAYITASTSDKDKVIVVLYKWRSMSSLETALFHYRRVVSPVVSKIVISWNPSLGTPPPELSKYTVVKDPSVDLLLHRFESIGNVLQPIPGLSASHPVFLADDEHLPDLEKLEIALETWKNSPHSLVGFFARYHGKMRLTEYAAVELDDPQVSTANYQNATSNLPYYAISPNDNRYQWTLNLTSIKRARPYSLLTGSLLLLNSDYLFAYTCLLPERIHRFLDEQEDEEGVFLTLNLLASGMSGSRPVLVRSDFSDPEALKFASAETVYAKGKLLQEVSKMFVGNGVVKDALAFNNIVVGQFNKIPFKKRSIKRWNDP